MFALHRVCIYFESFVRITKLILYWNLFCITYLFQSNSERKRRLRNLGGSPLPRSNPTVTKNEWRHRLATTTTTTMMALHIMTIRQVRRRSRYLFRSRSQNLFQSCFRNLFRLPSGRWTHWVWQAHWTRQLSVRDLPARGTKRFKKKSKFLFPWWRKLWAAYSLLCPPKCEYSRSRLMGSLLMLSFA